MAANLQVTIPQRLAANNPQSSDLVLGVNNVGSGDNVVKITVGNLLGNSNVDFAVANARTLSVNTVIIRNLQTPANSTANVQGGTLFYDSNYAYIAVANSIIKRIPLEAF